MRPARTLLIGCTAAVLTGCSSSDRPVGNTPASTHPNGSRTAAAASGAGVESADLSRVLVEQDVTLPGRPLDKLRLGVQSLSVRGKVMVLRVVVTPRFGSVGNEKVLSLYDALGGYFRPQLIDGVHLKEYSVVGVGERWVSSETEVSTANGSAMLAWAYFAAPQDAIRSVSVRVSDAWPAFTDVPIAR